MRYHVCMIPMIPRHALILAGIALGMSVAPLHAASAAPSPADRAKEAVRSAGFSIPGFDFPAAIGVSQGVPVPQQEPTVGGRTWKENEDFQFQLYIMALEPVDEAFCDGKLGVRNPKNDDEYRACRITRNFLWVIQNDPNDLRDNKGLFPELAALRYCRTPAERKFLLARLEEASK